MGIQERKHILLITTGGTIASVPGGEGLEPRRSDVLEREIHQLRTYYDITIQDLMCLDSSNIQPEDWVAIAEAIFAARGTCDGIVVSHGTDTMAYTASMVTFMLPNMDLPVVFTGSQLPLADFLSDAPANLRTAFAMAATGKPGIFLAFDRKVMLGCRAVKVRASGFNAFESINRHYVGRVTAMGLELDEQELPQVTGPAQFCPQASRQVFLLKLTPGVDTGIIDMLVDIGYKGIVVEAFGLGGMNFLHSAPGHGIRRAVDRGVSVVICSQCLYDSSNLDVYQVGKKLLSLGVIQGRDMTSEAAMAKLMWALGQGYGQEEIRKLFETSLAGEITLVNNE